MTNKKSVNNKDRDAAIKNFQGFRFGPEDPLEFIPTGHPVLDQTIASGHIVSKDKANEMSETTTGGLPRGKISMLYGGPGSGKSSLAYRVCGYAQQMGGLACWYDTELSFSPQLAIINGVDMKYIGRYDIHECGNKFYGEAILDSMIDACNKGAAVVVLDSVADLIPKTISENTLEKETMGLLARMLARGLPKIAQAAAKSNTCVILINQLRTKIGNIYGSPDTTTGGNALPHNSSVIIKMNKLNSKETQIILQEDDGTEIVIGQTSNCYLEKNRFGIPHREAIPVPVYFKPYFPEFEEILFNVGRRCKSISVRNGVFSWGGIKEEGRKAFIEAIKEQGKIDELVAEVKDVATAESTPLPPEILNYESHLKAKIIEDKKAETKKKKKGKEVEAAAANPDL
jgi:recombination protein RecA